MLPKPTAEPVAANMKTQRLAQLPWTETLSVDIEYHAQASEKEAALSGIHSTCSSTQHHRSRGPFISI
ncbi:hypothetical protein EMIT0215P_100063 [Pseudomonas serboccidentalis]